MEEFVYKNQKKLRCGITTGTCAAAAAKGAVFLLLSGCSFPSVTLSVPKGMLLEIPIEQSGIRDGQAVCAVRKDSGDDPDVTNGILVFASARRIASGIQIDGGPGVGRVTKPGLDQPVGAAAINSVPRQMITNAVQEVLDELQETTGIAIEIAIPDGIALAEKTFNPQLGIQGGISILGTSGIVEPMSEQALIDTIRTECRQRRALGDTLLLTAPGNYGVDFLKSLVPRCSIPVVKCSNFIGDTIDLALELGFSSMMLVGHIGKLVKLGSGIFQTHSRYADGRIETLLACGIEAGVPIAVLQQLLDCVTTDATLELLHQEGYLMQTMDCLTKRIDTQLQRRTGAKMEIGCAYFSKDFGLLGATPNGKRWLEGWK